MSEHDDDAGETETNKYSAAPAALGYLAQVEFALLLTLQRLDEALDFDISIETLDDIVFHGPGPDKAGELLQTKHRVDRTASLNDSSTDIWKTLHNWITDAPAGAALTLLTNATAAEGSAAYWLRPGFERDVDRARAILERVARTSENRSHQPYYREFLLLDADQRRHLLDQVTVVDAQPDVIDLEQELILALRKAVLPRYRTVLVERLRGWWVSRVYDHLTSVANGMRDRIPAYEIESVIHAISQRLRDDDLPIDFYDMPSPTDGEVSSDDRIFVEQLRLIALGNGRIRQCIHDHNRAFAQRSRWEREKLLHVGELKEYETKLREEWRRHCLPETDDESPEDAQANARRRFLRLEKTTLPRIRAHVDASYVGTGSLHMLADRLEIGWHPEWINQLRHLMPELEQESESAA